jgi:hypothetical protein
MTETNGSTIVALQVWRQTDPKNPTKILGFIEHIVETMVTAPKHIVEMYGE